MTGEDKMNRIFVYIGIIAGLLLGGSLSVEAQKKPLDIEACTSWKRIDAPDISPTGRWVTYVRHFHQTVTHFKCFVQVDFIVG